MTTTGTTKTTKRVPPSPERIAQALGEALTQDGAVMARLLAANKIIASAFTTNGVTAKRWIDMAVESGEVIRLRVSVQGAHVQKIVPNTTGSAHEWMHDTLTDEPGTGYIDKNGRLGFKRPDGADRPMDGSWISTAAVVEDMAAQMIKHRREQSVQFHADQVLKETLLDVRYGAEIRQVNGLIELMPSWAPLLIETHVRKPREEGQEERVVLTLRFEDDQIGEIAELLKRLGVTPSDELPK